MKIQYFGHSCFVLTSDAGTSIMTDPFGGIGFELPRRTVDAVTVSHGHYDHNNVSAVRAHTVLSREGHYTVGDFTISATKSYHDEVKGEKRGENLIFQYHADDVTVCHLGDLGEPFLPETASKFEHADVLLIPVGGTYTLDAAQAKEYVDHIRPKIVIPMHYLCRGLRLDIAPPDKFLHAFPENTVERISASEYEIDKNVWNDQIKIILMERYQ